MPGKIISPYKQVPETKANRSYHLPACSLSNILTIVVDWAELVTLDLSLFDKPGGKEKLAEQLTYAAQHVGFFYVKNFRISQEEVDRQFALGREFYDLPLEEKMKYHNSDDLRNGEYNGYRPAGWRQSVTSTNFSNVANFNPG